MMLRRIAKVAGIAFSSVSVANCKAVSVHPLAGQAAPASSRALPQWICASRHPMFFDVVKQVVIGSVTTIHTKGWYPQLLDPFCLSHARSQLVSFDTSEFHDLPLLALVNYRAETSFADLWNNVEYQTGSIKYKATINSVLVFIRDDQELMPDEFRQKLEEACKEAETYNVRLSIVVLVP